MERHPLADWIDAGDAPPPDDEPEASPDDVDGAHTSDRRPRVLLCAGAAALGLVAFLAIQTSAADSSDAGDGRQSEPVPAVPEDRAAAHDVAPPGATAAASVALRLDRSARGDQRSRYVDLVAVEGAEQRGSVWVIRLRAVVLEGDDEGWRETSVEQWAVPVSAEEPFTPLASPWRLPKPEQPPPGGPEWTRATDTDGVGEALAVAGYEGADGLEVQQADGLLRAVFIAAGEPHEVWLAREPEPRVLGASSDPAPRPPASSPPLPQGAH